MKPPWLFYDPAESYRRAKANEAKRQRGADAVVERALAHVRARMDGDDSFPSRRSQMVPP